MFWNGFGLQQILDEPARVGDARVDRVEALDASQTGSSSAAGLQQRGGRRTRVQKSELVRPTFAPVDKLSSEL